MAVNNIADNKKTGRAVADIAALYFLKHSDNGGAEPKITDALDTTGTLITKWFPVLTIKGSVVASQDAPSLEDIKVDQFDAAIGTTSESGDFNFEAQLPSLFKADIEQWLGSDNVEVTEVTTAEGKTLIGFNLDSQLIDASVLIKTDTGDTIIFSHVQLSLSFSKEDKVFLFRVNGKVLAPSNSENKMVYVATGVISSGNGN